MALTMIVATLRRVAVSFSVRPRESKGAIKAKVGESTSWTKVVAAKSWMVLGTSSIGLIKALLSREREGQMSA